MVITVVGADLLLLLRMMYTIIRFVDLWYLQKEMQYHLGIIGAMIVVICVSSLTIIYTSGDTIHLENGQGKVHVIWENYNITALYLQIGWIAMLFVSGVLVIQWNEAQQHLVDKSKKVNTIQRAATTIGAIQSRFSILIFDKDKHSLRSKEDHSKTLHTSSITQQPSLQGPTLEDLLRSGQGYEAFMVHLTHEFSIGYISSPPSQKKI
ncbi:hypothetical protein RFI_19221 [Reticulomyxa filosa]|uniref:Uncharacterized protein n=1 Tax=Reticulomyxa filosa TaxID=46433 RepID=X6MW63_RETFI|nr:hypothetical protein RFI_19221 [Reticulomyxa filosa]|eukprot:ETO18069.1 hypothetical protein RFI_19221 [Reticulomyxa filosa]